MPGQKRVSNRPITAGTSPMKRVELSSVHYPSDASPQLNKDLNILDRRVFGTPANFVHWEKGKKLATGQVGTDFNLEREFAIADEGEEVNDMLIDAIKAKLAILDEMDK